MPVAGGLGSPLLYAVIVGWIGLVAAAFYQAIFHSIVGSALRGLRRTGRSSRALLGWLEGWAGFVAQVVFGGVLVVIGVFVAAGILHLMLLLLGRRAARTSRRRSGWCASRRRRASLLPRAVLRPARSAVVWGLVLYVIGLAAGAPDRPRQGRGGGAAADRPRCAAAAPGSSVPSRARSRASSGQHAVSEARAPRSGARPPLRLVRARRPPLGAIFGGDRRPGRRSRWLSCTSTGCRSRSASSRCSPACRARPAARRGRSGRLVRARLRGRLRDEPARDARGAACSPPGRSPTSRSCRGGRRSASRSRPGSASRCACGALVLVPRQLGLPAGRRPLTAARGPSLILGLRMDGERAPRGLRSSSRSTTRRRTSRTSTGS